MSHQHEPPSRNPKGGGHKPENAVWVELTREEIDRLLADMAYTEQNTRVSSDPPDPIGDALFAKLTAVEGESRRTPGPVPKESEIGTDAPPPTAALNTEPAEQQPSVAAWLEAAAEDEELERLRRESPVDSWARDTAAMRGVLAVLIAKLEGESRRTAGSAQAPKQSPLASGRTPSRPVTEHQPEPAEEREAQGYAESGCFCDEYGKCWHCLGRPVAEHPSYERTCDSCAELFASFPGDPMTECGNCQAEHPSYEELVERVANWLWIFTGIGDTAAAWHPEARDLLRSSLGYDELVRHSRDAFAQIKRLAPGECNRSDIEWICDQALSALGYEAPDEEERNG